MPQSILLIFVILLVVICEAFAQSSAHILSHTGDMKYLLLGMLFYGGVVYLLAKSHKITNMAIANGIMSSLSIITISLVGYFAFEQKIKTNQMIALGVAASCVGYLACNSEAD